MNTTNNQTMTLLDILTTLRQHKSRLQDRYGIRRLAVFGSYARGEQKLDSDIDILVELGEKPLGMAYFSLVREIAALFPIKTEVISHAAIKPRYLATIQEDLRDV